MFKSKRGSVTFIAYVAMLFFAMYGVILYSNSVSAYNIQSTAMKNIKDTYAVDISEETMRTLYNNISTPIQDN